MYKDKEKKFDLRVVEKNIERGIITREEYEAHLLALPDVAGKVSDGHELHFSSSRHEPTKDPASEFATDEP